MRAALDDVLGDVRQLARGEQVLERRGAGAVGEHDQR